MFLAVVLAGCALDSVWAQVRAIDVEHSTMTVRVLRSGLFSVFAHNHEIRAPLAAGTVDEGAAKVEVSLRSAGLRVMDADISDKDRAEIQTTMLGPKVLDIARFPEIRFVSREAERLGPQRWRVKGDLTLHGVTHPVEVQVAREANRYRGQSTVRQHDFGMVPVKVAGGTVSVKDEVRIEFDIALR